MIMKSMRVLWCPGIYETNNDIVTFFQLIVNNINNKIKE